MRKKLPRPQDGATKEKVYTILSFAILFPWVDLADYRASALNDHIRSLKRGGVLCRSRRSSELRKRPARH